VSFKQHFSDLNDSLVEFRSHYLWELFLSTAILSVQEATYDNVSRDRRGHSAI